LYVTQHTYTTTASHLDRGPERRVESMSLPAVAVAYLDHLTAGRFADAARCFGETGFYSHPAYDPDATGPTSRRLEARGRVAIQEVFELRGVRSWTHDIRSDSVDDRFYIDGRVRDSLGAEVLSYLAVGRLGDDGLIQSYVVYDARPPVGDPGVAR
jgi:hypothetical protein